MTPVKPRRRKVGTSPMSRDLQLYIALWPYISDEKMLKAAIQAVKNVYRQKTE